MCGRQQRGRQQRAWRFIYHAAQPFVAVRLAVVVHPVGVEVAHLVEVCRLERPDRERAAPGVHAMRRRAARAGGGRTHAGGGARALAPAGASERGARALARLARGGRAGGPAAPARNSAGQVRTDALRTYEERVSGIPACWHGGIV